MHDIFEQIPNWDLNSVLIYMISVLSATIFAIIYNKRKKRKKGKYIWIILSYSSIWFVLAFSACGADYASYKRIFENSLSPAYWAVARIEKGYILFNAIIRLFTSDFVVFHVIWATCMLIIIYKVILSFEKEINIGLAVFTFGSVYCFQAMNLMRMYFTMALTLMAFRYYIDKKYYGFLACMCISFFLHRSSICLLLPMVMAILFRSQRKMWVKVAAVTVMFAGIYAMRSYLFADGLLSYRYTVSSTPTLGFANIIYHLPILFISLYAMKRQRYDREKIRLYIIYSLVSFLFGWLGYIVTMIGRTFVYFSPIYIIYPAYILEHKIPKDIDRRRLSLTYFDLLKFIYIVFVIFRSFMMTGFFFTDQIMPYISIFTK